MLKLVDMVNPMIASIEVTSCDEFYYVVNITMTNCTKHDNIILNNLQFQRLIEVHNPQIINSAVYCMTNVKKEINSIQ